MRHNVTKRIRIHKTKVKELQKDKTQEDNEL